MPPGRSTPRHQDTLGPRADSHWPLRSCLKLQAELSIWPDGLWDCPSCQMWDKHCASACGGVWSAEADISFQGLSLWQAGIPQGSLNLVLRHAWYLGWEGIEGLPPRRHGFRQPELPALAILTSRSLLGWMVESDSYRIRTRMG